MIVTAVLVSHDGQRWLPAVLAGLAAQTRPVDATVAVDTGSQDRSPELLAEALGADNVVRATSEVSYPEAVELGVASLAARADAASTHPGEDWIWLLHDDSNPSPEALATLLQAAQDHPEARILGPKIREWPSLRRLLEVGVTLSGTGRRETGLERGEYDQGQHDEVRQVLAVNTAGMLVRRDVLQDLGGFDPQLPIFGNDLDFGWRAGRAGHGVLVVPRAVLFHAEASSDGARVTELTGDYPHRADRAAALYTLLANVPSRKLAWQTLRLFLGTLLRVLGFLVVRAPGEARDELLALWDVYSRPRVVRAGRRWRAAAGRSPEPAQRRAADRRASRLLARWWVPYRHGLDALVDLGQALTAGASDVAERRRAQKALTTVAPTVNAPAAPVRPRGGAAPGADDEEVYADTGWVARFITNPVALGLLLVLVLVTVAAREAFGTVIGGALSPVPAQVGDWWRLYLDHHHSLGTGSDVAAPGYVPLLALLGSVLGGPTHAISVLMLGSVPLAIWGAWRLLRVLGHVVDDRGLPRWTLMCGAVAYGLVPATSGAWGQGRFGVVVAAAVLPWLAHAALGFADPEPRRRWRAAWRSGVLLALTAAFVPMMWPVAVALVLVVQVLARLVSRAFWSDRSLWLPPLVSLAVVPLLLAPWLLPLLFSSARTGLLLEAGRLPVSSVSAGGLLTGHLDGAGSPIWIGIALLVLAVLALVPRASRLAVLGCWVVALASAVVVAALSLVTLDLGVVQTRPGVGLFVVLLQGTFVAAMALGAGALARSVPRPGRAPMLHRVVWGVGVLATAAVPMLGLGWWLVDSDSDLVATREAVVPTYMAQSSADRVDQGVLILSGSVAKGLTYRIRRDDGITVGEDEILALTPENTDFTGVVSQLTASATPEMVDRIAEVGVRYVVMAAPVDARIAATLDATAGLQPASAENRSTRAWQVVRPMDDRGLAQVRSPGRTVLLVLQLVSVLVLLVLCGPDLRRERGCGMSGPEDQNPRGGDEKPPTRPAGGRRRAAVAPDSPSTVEMPVIKRRADDAVQSDAAPAVSSVDDARPDGAPTSVDAARPDVPEPDAPQPGDGAHPQEGGAPGSAAAPPARPEPANPQSADPGAEPVPAPEPSAPESSGPPPAPAPRQRRSTPGGINPLSVLSVVLPLLTVAALLLVQPSGTTDLRSAPSRVPLVAATVMCPAEEKQPSLVGLADPSVGGSVTGTSRVTLAPGAVAEVTGPSIVGDATTSAGLVATHVADKQGLTCAMPQFDQWFAGVGAGAQHRSTLVLSNPDAGTAVADLAVHGPSGRLDLADLRGISVPGGATVSLNLAERVPRAQDLALHVSVSRGRLGVTVRDTFEDIETKKRSADWMTPQRAPATDVRLVGLGTGRGRRTVTVLNPGRSQARVELQVISPESEFTPTEVEAVSLPPGAVRTVDLSAVLGNPATTGASGVRVLSTRPVAAGLTSVIGTDLVAAAPVVPLRQPAGVPLPSGTQRLVLVGAATAGQVTVRTRTAAGTERAPQQVSVSPGRDHRLTLPDDVRWVSVEPGRTRVGGVVELGAQRHAVLALWPFVLDDRVPAVRPALR